MSAVTGGPWPEGVHERMIDIPGGALAVLDADPIGERKATVVLVPGFTGSKEDFGPLLPALTAAGYRAVAIDQRGQYQSPGLDDPAAYTTEVLGSDVIAFVKALGDGPVHLVAHSFGGLVSRQAVLQETSAFLSFVLLDSGPAGLIGPRAELLPFMRQILIDGGTEAVWDVQSSLPPNPEKPINSPETKAFLRTRMVASSPIGMLAMGDSLLSEPDLVADLKATRIRMLVMYGERDDAWPPATQADMAVRLGCEAVVIANAWHSPAVEQTDATAAALLAFLDGVRQ